MWKKATYTYSRKTFNARVFRVFFLEFYKNIITFLNPYLLKIIIEEECGGDSSENNNNTSSYDKLNDNFNDDYPKINIDDFSGICEDHYVTFDNLDLLSRDNDDTEEYIIPS